MRRLLSLLLIAVLAGSTTLSLPQTAAACPMCKTANEQDPNRPKAYMYSILFMLTMPAIIFGSFGYGLYVMNKRETENSQQLLAGQDAASDATGNGSNA
jgi:hypothetical protein